MKVTDLPPLSGTLFRHTEAVNADPVPAFDARPADPLRTAVVLVFGMGSVALVVLLGWAAIAATVYAAGGGR